jgi:molybdopterin adenylyltransferase
MMPITIVILAGGRGSRIGGDKGLQCLHGRTLLAWVLDALSSQGDELLVSANSRPDDYAELGCPVIADQTPGWIGPLAGLQSAMRQAKHDLVACVPCDTPFLPKDLIARLFAALGNNEAVVAVSGGRRQPTIALYRKTVLAKLDDYISSGERKVGGWLDTLKVSEVVFDEVDAFANINSLEELAVANYKMTNTLKIGLVSISDRASSGVYQDAGLPALQDWFTQVLSSPWQSITRLIPDEQQQIETTLIELADLEGCHLILTTGGTGPAPRDVTPEATLAVAHKVLPGFGEQMRAVSLRYVPTAILSRQVGVVRGQSLILNLPGQPKAIKETLDGIFAAVPYCLDLIGGPYVETKLEMIAAFRPKSAQRAK